MEWAAQTLTALVVLAGCSIPEAVVMQTAPSRDVGRVSSLDLKPGRSKLGQLTASLRARGATGIALSRGWDAGGTGTILHALTADHLGAVLLFKGSRFSESLSLKADRGTDRGLYIKLAKLGRANVVVVVSESLTVHGEHGIRIIAEEGTRRFYVQISRDYFPEWIYGMKDPLLVGHDLKEGLTFVARKASEIPGRYVPWHRGAIVSFDGRRLSVEAVLLQRLLACSCIDNWFNLPPERRQTRSALNAPSM